MTRLLWRLVEQRLRQALPRERVDHTLGDLMEDHARRRAARGALNAAVWVIRECRSLTRAYGRTPARPPRRRSLFDAVSFDALQAWRAVRARPTATLATVAVLALGIGLVSAMFALADPYLFRPLPYPHPEAIAAISLRARPSGPPVPRLSDWQTRHTLFSTVAAYGDPRTLAIDREGEETTLNAVPVSVSFFELLGMPPPDGDWIAARNVMPAMLSAAAFRRLFPDRDGIGTLLPRVEGGVLRIAGVLPERFLFPSARSRGVEALVPLADTPLAVVESTPSGRGFYSADLAVLARLQPGITPEIVSGALSVPAERDRPGLAVSAELLTRQLTRRHRPQAFGALAAGLLILLVSAANVANLLLARGAHRTREFAAREALGARRADLGRLVLAELVLLSIAGAAGGLLLAHVAVRVATLVIPAEYVAFGAPSITLRVAAFGGAAALVVMAAGMVPAMAAWRVASTALFAQTTAVESRKVRALRFCMTAAQCAVAVILAIGAALLGRSQLNLLNQDPGFQGDTFSIGVLYPAGRPGEALIQDVEATLAKLRAIPGVDGAAATRGSLLDGSVSISAGGVMLNGRRVAGQIKQVTPGFFDATGTPVTAGRGFTAADRDRATVVNESFATACCEGASPIGLTISSTQPLQIVGIVKDMYDGALDQRPAPSVFAPLTVLQSTGTPRINYAFRTARADRTLIARIEREIRAVNRSARVSEGRTLHERLMASVNDRSFAAMMVGFFALAAIGVTVAGLTGVIGFLIARRTREIAIRMAIGADASRVRLLVLRETLTAAGAGIALGFAAGLWVAGMLEALLYGLTPADPSTLAVAAAVMIAIVALSAWVPAQRALRLSPSEALRRE